MSTLDSHVIRQDSVVAVDGQDIHFYFGRKREAAVLNGVNIAVNSGTVYTLLGPSGCGKTTLLKCIVGQLRPKAGSLQIYGRCPGSKGFFIPGRGVGYMPQDLALYMEMTTEEILEYFGSLYGMDRQSIKERINFLVAFLKLPDKRKPIGHLSGGQQRRLSFAIALIHKPPLLILDEPTVGVDPILRKAIWNHLLNLSKNEHLTIIITTHYTEEARQADMVGLMRNGRLLVERDPEGLIKQYGGFTLEDVFLKLCEKDQNDVEDLETNINEIVTDTNLGLKNIRNTNGTVLDEKTNGESCSNGVEFGNAHDGSLDGRNDFHDNRISLLPQPLFSKDCDRADLSPTNPCTRLLVLTKKNFVRLKRNLFFVISTTGVAAVQTLLFFLCLSSDPFDIQVAVSNEERGLNQYSETFLSSINNHTVYQKQFDNFISAYESLEKGESWAILHFNSEFSTCLVDRILEGMAATNDTLQCSTIDLTVDMSNYIIAGTILRSLWETHEAFLVQLMKIFGAGSSSSETLLHVEYAYGSRLATFYEYVIPALILGSAYVTAIALTQMAMIAERKYGLMGRTLVAGATTTEVMLSFFFALLALLFIQIGIILGITFIAFNATCKGPIFWVIIATTLTGICGMSFGFLISALTDDENAGCIISLGSFFPAVLLCGTFWPLEAMPYYLRYFSVCLPLTKIIESARLIMARGWNITDGYVWGGYLICFFWITVHMVLSSILLKIRR